MAEWKKYTVADVISTVIDYRGKTPKKLGGDWSDSGYRALSAKNIKTGKIVQPDSIRYVSEDMYRCWMKEEVQKDDILITSEAPFGQIYYWDSEEKIVLSQRLFAIRINQRFYPKYIYFYMTSSFFQAELDGRATGTTVVGLRQPELLKCKIFAPDYQEQKRIADTLWCLEQKINNNEAINNNLEEQALALFKSYFIDYDNFEGQAPDTWKEGVLGDFVEIKRGGSPRPIQNYLSNSGLHWLKISDATCITSPFINEIKEYIIEDGLKKTVFLKAGALVLSNSATPGLPKILDIDTCIHDGWLYFPTSKLSNEYLYLFFKHIREKLVALGNGSVFTNLKTDILKNYPTFLPTQEVLNEFDSIVKPIFEMILATTREIKSLTTLRDTLLPKLMSGELDVSDLEI